MSLLLQDPALSFASFSIGPDDDQDDDDYGDQSGEGD